MYRLRVFTSGGSARPGAACLLCCPAFRTGEPAHDFMKPRPHVPDAFQAFRPSPRSSAVYPAGSLSRPGGIFRHFARDNTDRRHIPADPHVPPACSPSGAVCFRGLRVFSAVRHSGRAKPAHDFLKPRPHVPAAFSAFRPHPHSPCGISRRFRMYRLRVHLRGQCASEGRTSPLLFRRSARDNTDRRHIPADPHVPPACSPSGAVCFRGLRVFSAVRRSGRAKPVHDFMKPRQCVPDDFPAFRPRQHRSAAYSGGSACSACVSSPSGAVCVRGPHVFSAVRHSGRAKPAHDFMKPRPHVSADFPAFRPSPDGMPIRKPHVPPACIHLRGLSASGGRTSSLLPGIPDG